MNENDFIGNGNTMDGAQPQAWSQSSQGQAMEGMVSDPMLNYKESKKSHNKSLMVIIAIIAVIVVVIVAVAVVLLVKNNNINLASVKNYCEKNGLEINEGSSEVESKMEYIICTSKGETNYYKGYSAYSYDTPANPDYISLFFGVAEKPLTEYSQSVEAFSEKMDYGSVLEDSNNYKKIYEIDANNTITYLIISDNTYIRLVASDNNLAKKALIEIGYPDSNWPTEQDIQNISNSGSGLQISNRNTQRRNDISKVDVALTQYQTNYNTNANNLPTGPSYWQGMNEIKCENTNEACKFARDYMNNSKTNNFVDPSGIPYSFYITENWIENDAITPTFGNNNSYLVEVSDGYTIGGDEPFNEHIVYIIPGGECNSGSGEIIKSSAKNHYAILYYMEGGETYCIDDK